jgi:hypothetical protein
MKTQATVNADHALAIPGADRPFPDYIEFSTMLMLSRFM